MIYLKEFRKKNIERRDGYPLCLDIIQDMDRLVFDCPVTMLCGDNGCGKTTLIELIAQAISAHRVGLPGGLTPAQQLLREASLRFTPVFAGRPRKNFIFTAEGFTKYIEFLVAEKEESREELAAVREEYGDRYAGKLAAQPYARTIAEINGMYEQPLEERSHGQGFLDFFRSRIVEGGLYLLDEPEAALSYGNQLALIYIMQDAVKNGCQFILATHSPILTAYPGARLLEIAEGGIKPRAYDDLASISFLKRFMFRHESLLSDGEPE